MTDRYTWKRQETIGREARDAERLAEWNRLATEARAAPRPPPAPPPVAPPPAPPGWGKAQREARIRADLALHREMMDAENREIRAAAEEGDEDARLWTWLEWCTVHRLTDY